MRYLAWLTAILSVLIIGIVAGATILYVATKPSEVINDLASAVLSGVGAVLGAALGSLIVLRFKVVRIFLHNLIHRG